MTSRAFALFASLYSLLALLPGTAQAFGLSPLSDTHARIVRVKVIVDDRLWVWDLEGLSAIAGDGGSASEPDASVPADVKESSSVFLPGTVVTFLSFAPGDSMYDSELRKQCRISELRIRASGCVYDADVSVIPPRNNANERTVIVTVTSGFLWRFNGGDFWVSLGRQALGGGRGSVQAWVGWNRNGIRYFNPRTRLSPLVVGAAATYRGPGDDPTRPSDDPLVEGTATLGWSFHPDAHAGLEGSVLTAVGPVANANNGFPEQGLYAVGPYVAWKRFLPGIRDNPPATVSGKAMVSAYPQEEAIQGEAFAVIRVPLSARILVACKAAGGYTLGKVPDAVDFDLYSVEDRNVRSGYRAEYLIAPAFAFASAELRVTAFSFTLPPVLPCSIEPFVFIDAAAIGAGSRSDNAFAFGLGTRILFDNPVFAWFSFSYGVNPAGDGRFVFCGTAGY